MSAPTVRFLTSPHILFEGDMAYCAVELNAGDSNGFDLPMSTIEAFDGVRWVDGIMYQIGQHTTRCTITWRMAKPSDTQTKFWLTNTQGESSDWIDSDDCTYPPANSLLNMDLIGLGLGVATITGLYMFIRSMD